MQQKTGRHSIIETDHTLEEQVIIPSRHTVMEGGGLVLDKPGPAPSTRRTGKPLTPKPVQKEKQARGTRECRCGATISANKMQCRDCANSMREAVR